MLLLHPLLPGRLSTAPDTEHARASAISLLRRRMVYFAVWAFVSPKSSSTKSDVLEYYPANLATSL